MNLFPYLSISRRAQVWVTGQGCVHAAWSGHACQRVEDRRQILRVVWETVYFRRTVPARVHRPPVGVLVGSIDADGPWSDHRISPPGCSRRWPARSGIWEVRPRRRAMSAVRTVGCQIGCRWHASVPEIQPIWGSSYPLRRGRSSSSFASLQLVKRSASGSHLSLSPTRPTSRTMLTR